MHIMHWNPEISLSRIRSEHYFLIGQPVRFRPHQENVSSLVKFFKTLKRLVFFCDQNDKIKVMNCNLKLSKIVNSFKRCNT